MFRLSKRLLVKRARISKHRYRVIGRYRFTPTSFKIRSALKRFKKFNLVRTKLGSSKKSFNINVRRMLISFYSRNSKLGLFSLVNKFERKAQYGLLLKSISRIGKYRKLILSASIKGFNYSGIGSIVKLHLNFLNKKFFLGFLSGRGKHPLPTLEGVRRNYRPINYGGLGLRWFSSIGTYSLEYTSPCFNFSNATFTGNFGSINYKNAPVSYSFDFLNFVLSEFLLSKVYSVATHSFTYNKTLLSSISRVYCLHEHTISGFNSIFNIQTLVDTFVSHNGAHTNIFLPKSSDYTCNRSFYSLPVIPNRFYRYISLSIKSSDFIKYGRGSFTLYCKQAVLPAQSYRLRCLNLMFLNTQSNLNRAVSASRFAYGKGPARKPNIFSFKTTLNDYLSKSILIARQTSPYFYWNGSVVSSTFSTVNGLLITPYLMNMNDNLWENNLYLQFNSIKIKPDPLTKLFSVDNQGQGVVRKSNFNINRVGTSRLPVSTYLANRGVMATSKYFKDRFAVMMKKLLTSNRFIKLPYKFIYSRRPNNRSFSKNLVYIKRIFALRRRVFNLTVKQIGYLTRAKRSNEGNQAKKSPRFKKGKNFVRKIRKPVNRNRLLAIIKLTSVRRKLLGRYIHRMQVSKWVNSVGLWSSATSLYLLKIKRLKFNKSKRNRRMSTSFFKLKRVSKSLVVSLRKTRAVFKDPRGTLVLPSVLGYLDRNQISTETANSVRVVSGSAPINHLVDFDKQLRGASLSASRVNADSFIFNLFFLNTALRSPLVFKYLLYKQSSQLNKSSYDLTKYNSDLILKNLELFYFGSRLNILQSSNLNQSLVFNFSLRRRMLKLFTFRKFSTVVTVWYYNMLVRFFEFCTGRKVYIKLNPFIEKSLRLTDQIQCRIWENRVAGFQRILGPKLFLKESLRILMLALKYKDPTFLINWIKAMLYRMSFWKYRSLFRYIKFVLRNLFEPNFKPLGLRGFKLKLKGKISVAGNARTRTLLIRVGQTSNAKFDNKVAHGFTLVNSFSGVMGFNIWIYF